MSKLSFEKDFKGTYEVYGVDPKILAEMPYKEAIKVKRSHAVSKMKEVASRLKKLYGQFDGQVNGKVASEVIELHNRYQELDKAINLCNLQLKELEGA